MKTASFTVAKRIAEQQIANGCFVSRHACKLDVRPLLLWVHDEDIEAGIQAAQNENLKQTKPANND